MKLLEWVVQFKVYFATDSMARKRIIQQYVIK